ncbi:gluconate 2-dehydrogenase subunit 3 family protein [Jiulongibacter sediminis]|uniref:Gluconate 2-dehydrogenase subunit 3 family protein n=1 Tax=Jiulongibacter sediminis TaxID=1605367 RepID=A0A0P7C4Z2_9BACT|nr:gluconate 2-dehydrogenase subunit 3 family protein [Jiulongibacter sediminis]KPM48327.1 hypothetical protein AFM12_06660 [Jiulongibacter sediminis]TBX24864.1 hypothetical protein TK44_06665 [Jiulongibacter sediminis]
MKRRALLKNLALGTGAAMTLPGWAYGWQAGQVRPSGRFTPAEGSLIRSVADTFIPEGLNEPGAVSLGVDQFMDRLFADCYELEDLARVKTGLKDLDTYARKVYAQTFSECNQGQRESILMAFSSPSDEEKAWLYDTLRRETIRGYTTSEYVMVNHYDYVMAPGFFDGCVDVI